MRRRKEISEADRLWLEENGFKKLGPGNYCLTDEIYGCVQLLWEWDPFGERSPERYWWKGMISHRENPNRWTMTGDMETPQEAWNAAVRLLLEEPEEQEV